MRLVSGVGSEEVEFEPAIPLEGKVEIYMQVTTSRYLACASFSFKANDFSFSFQLLSRSSSLGGSLLDPNVESVSHARPVSFTHGSKFYVPQDILDVIKSSLYNNLKRSLSRYLEMSRPEWLMHKNPTSGEFWSVR